MEPSLQPFRLQTLLLYPAFILQIHKSKGARQSAIVPHACNLSTQEAEAGEHLQVLGQLDLISKTLKRTANTFLKVSVLHSKQTDPPKDKDKNMIFKLY